MFTCLLVLSTPYVTIGKDNNVGIGIKYTTNGYGMYAEMDSYLKNDKINLLKFDFSEFIHPKEYNIKREISGFDTHKYKFGKKFSNYFIKFYLGGDYSVFKFDSNNSPLKFKFFTGINLNFRKYYGILYKNSNLIDGYESIIYNDNNENKFLDRSNIIGSERWWKNLKFNKINPGVSINIELSYCISSNKSLYTNNFVIGSELSYFFHPISQLIEIKSKNNFYNAYFGYEFSFIRPQYSKFKDKW